MQTTTNVDIKLQLKNISQRLNTTESQQAFNNDWSLLNGLSGLALANYYYLNKYTEHSFLTSQSNHSLIDSIIHLVNNDNEIGTTFCSGLSGFAWFYNHLVNLDYIQDADLSLLGDFDTMFHKMAIWELKRGNYDFLHGAIGYGLYLLDRYDIQKNKTHIEEIIDLLVDSSIEDKYGVKWGKYDEFDEKKRYNLGLAHGIPSIIVFLSKCYDLDIKRDKLKPIIEKGVSFLNNQRTSSLSSLSLFPGLATQNTESNSSRLAWCYGDLGIANSFLFAGKSLHNNEFIDFSKTTVTHASFRRGLIENGIEDATFCHGSSGVAYMFSKFHDFFDDSDSMLDAKNHWLDKTLEYIAPYDFSKINNENAGLLNGFAGIYLTLTSMLSDDKYSWDKCILFS